MVIVSPLKREQHTKPRYSDQQHASSRHNDPKKMCKNAHVTLANGNTPLEKHLCQKDPRAGCLRQAQMTQEGSPAFDIYN